MSYFKKCLDYFNYKYGEYTFKISTKYNIIKKATNVNNKYATGKKIYLKNVTMLSSDNCITPIEYLENTTVTFYGYYNKDTVTQYLLVKVDATGKTGYIKNNFVEL